MRFLAIIQARCGSTRLPGKVLKDISGKTALERMLDRVDMATGVDEVMVATTINQEDIPIVKLVSDLGRRIFVGSSDDVLDRYYQAAKLLKPEYVIRLTADCPLLDPRVIDGAIELVRDGVDDVAMISETFPDGEDVEIVRFDALESAWKDAKLASEREHVTLYIKNHPELFNIVDYTCESGNLNEERWTLDEPEDYELICRVYEQFLPRIDFTLDEIYQYLANHPEIRNLNQKYVRNEGLIKSLKTDREVF